jgi:hypothetical protein
VEAVWIASNSLKLRRLLAREHSKIPKVYKFLNFEPVWFAKDLAGGGVVV